MRKKRFFFSWSFFLGLLSFPLLLPGKVYYVSPQGNDHNSGLSREEAWRSIDLGQPTLTKEDVRGGSSEIPVLKTNNFPEKGTLLINGVKIRYQGKRKDAFTGCENVPFIRKNTLVYSLDLMEEGKIPEPGDEIRVLPGVYRESVFLFEGGTSEKPLIYRGIDYPVIDGEDTRSYGVWIRTDNLILEGFMVRRANKTAVNIVSGKNVKISRSLLTRSQFGISLHYSRNIQVERNILWSIWNTAVVVDNSSEFLLQNNTIVNSGIGVSLYLGKNFSLLRNIIAYNRIGGIKEVSPGKGKQRIEENLFYKNGRIIWVPRDKPENHFVNFKNYPRKENIFESPLFISFEENKKEFLTPHISSPCYIDEYTWIGAKKPGRLPEIPSPPQKNLVPNSSFEGGWVYWQANSWGRFQGDEAGWKIVEGESYDGKRSLLLYYFPRGKWRPLSPRVSSVYLSLKYNQPYTLSFYAKSDTDATLTAGIIYPSWHSASGSGMSIKLARDWKRYRFTFKIPFSFPRRISVSFSIVHGRAWVDAVQLEEGKITDYGEEIEVYPFTEKNLIQPGEPIHFLLKNRSPRRREVTLLLKPAEVLGEKYPEKKIRIRLNPGEEKELRVRFSPGIQGLILLSYTLKERDKILKKDLLRVAIGNPPPRIPGEHFFGLVSYLDERTPIYYLEEKIADLRRLGFDLFHFYFSPYQLEKFAQPENRDLEKILSLMDKYEITPLLTFQGQGFIEKVQEGEETIGYFSRKTLEEWERIVEKFMRKFKGRRMVLEIFNEPNGHPKNSLGKSLTGKDYMEILKRTYPIIKKYQPESTVLGGSIVMHFWSDFSREVMRNLNGWADAFSIHPYRFLGAMNPDRGRTFREELDFIREELQKSGSPTDIYCTEEGMGMAPLDVLIPINAILLNVGVPLYSHYVTKEEILQADYMMRMYLTALTKGVKSYTYHLRLVQDFHFTPSVGFKSLHTMAYLLKGAVFRKELSLGEDFKGYLFRKGKELIAVIYSLDAEFGERYLIFLPSRVSLRGVNMTGGEIKIFKEGREKRILLNPSLNYLIFENISEEKLISLIETAYRYGREKK